MAEATKPIRFGIMGCAEIARKVSRAITMSPNSTLYAIASRSLEKAKQFAIKNGYSDEEVMIYGSYIELLDDPSVDAVYMPLPTSLHLEWAVLAAEKKKHLLLEKPTALNVIELDRILEACRSNGVQFMDGSMWYHHPRTAKIKEMLSDSELFGQVKTIYSSSSYNAGQGFLENNVRVKADLDSLGALGDAGWYCIGAILWAMNNKLPTTVTALPSLDRNSDGVILSCIASLHWEKEELVAKFFCSFLAHETMDLSISGSNGSLHLEDFIIPYEETSASFQYTTSAKFAELHIGWNVKPEEVLVDTSGLPQEARMVQEFSRLTQGIKYSGWLPDQKWAEVSRMTQFVLDAVMKSINCGFEPVHM
ncbi:putative oxidoreductase At4g09670 [Apium graveolens]|uniref:putative oxidoreductase At4g09670 n=1 Tax=Apium graveolens TaxID=4045 RepID=UPI003D79FACF